MIRRQGFVCLVASVTKDKPSGTLREEPDEEHLNTGWGSLEQCRQAPSLGAFQGPAAELDPARHQSSEIKAGIV